MSENKNVNQNASEVSVEEIKISFTKNTFATDQIAQVVKASIDENCTISKAKYNVKDVKEILSLVDQINALGRHAKTLNGVSLMDIDVPKWAAKLILPVEVVYDVALGDDAKDLLERPVADRSYEYNLEQIHKSAAVIAQAFRATPQYVSAAEARKAKGSVNFSSILPIAAIGENVATEHGKVFVPICLTSGLTVFFDEYYFNDDASHMLKTYLVKTHVCADNA